MDAPKKRTVVSSSQLTDAMRQVELELIKFNKAVKVLSETNLTERIIITILADQSGLPRRDVEKMVHTLKEFESKTFKKKTNARE
jgi:hypothetical protein